MYWSGMSRAFASVRKSMTRGRIMVDPSCVTAPATE
jgi:hypothetical protein